MIGTQKNQKTQRSEDYFEPNKERMKFHVEVISRETIKPSSRTPPNLQNYQLSFLDQLAPPVFMPLLFFYPADTNNKFNNMDRSNQMKKSLSETLTRFYPLAGRVIDSLFVQCNDAGVPYTEARIAGQISEVIRDPHPRELNELLPFELDGGVDVPLGIQVNFFECGGIAVCVCVSHKVADAASMVMFVNGWAGTARRDQDTWHPLFGSATLFPPRDMAGFKPSTGIVKENIMTERYVFTAAQITAIREKLAEKNSGDHHCKLPTRIEALSAFIWSRFLTASEAKPDPGKIYTMLHAVNLRTRIEPPLSEYHFGNISRIAVTAPPIDTRGEEQCYGVVKKMREAIDEINGDYVSKLRDGEKHLKFLKERAKSVTNGEVISFSFTSLCRFPLYEADFGWGKPVWVGSAGLTFKNLVIFMDTPTGGGIEAWVNLKGEDMAKFHKELLNFVSRQTSC